MEDVEGGDMVRDTGHGGRRRERMRPGRSPRAARVTAACTLVLTLGACDPTPGPSEPTGLSRTGPMDPDEVAAAELTAVGTDWLCGTEEGAGRPAHTGDPGVLTPATVSTDGDEIMVSGAFDPGAARSDLAEVVPDVLVAPAHTDNRGVPADPYSAEPGSPQYPQPEIVGVERVETTDLEGTPSVLTTRMRLGTCDGSALPDGAYLATLSGGGFPPSGGDGDPAGWSGSTEVLVDVVDGRLQPVPGAVTAPSGEIPADTSPLACGTPLEPVGDGDGLTVTAGDRATSVPASAPEDLDAVGVDATVEVTAPAPGTRALLEGIVLTTPEEHIVVAGARSTDTIGLQWFSGDPVSTAATAWTTTGTCSRSALEAGAYEAWGFALTVDADDATHLVLSDPWTVEVAADEG